MFEWKKSAGKIYTLPVESIRPSPFQARTVFDEKELTGLAQSIRENGLLQPISVRKVEGGYELVAGERRLRACQLAKMTTIPAILPTISTLLVLNIGSLCGSAAFEKVFLLYTPTTYETADIIATYVYRMGLGSGNYSYATAVGLFQGVINLVLLTVANKVSSWLTGSGLW